MDGIKEIFQGRTRVYIGLAALLAVVLNGGLAVLNAWLSPTGTVLDGLILGLRVLQAIVFVLLVMDIFTRLLVRQEWGLQVQRLLFLYVVYLLAGLGAYLLCGPVVDGLHLSGYRSFIAENRFVVDAIAAYQADHMAPPDELAALFPHYLSTTIANLEAGDASAGVASQAGTSRLSLAVPYRSIDARSAQNVSCVYRPDQDGAGWSLALYIYLGEFKYIKFFYNPDGIYPADTQPLDDWAYQERLQEYLETP